MPKRLQRPNGGPASIGLRIRLNKPRVRGTEEVILVVPNEVFCEGLRSILAGNRIKVSTSFDNLNEFNASRDSLRSDAIVLVDCTTEADVTLISDIAAQLQGHTPSVRIVILTAPETTGLWQLANLGIINAVVPRNISSSALVNLLYLVWDDFVVTPIGLMQTMKLLQKPEPMQIDCVPPAVPDHTGLLNEMKCLSNREREILILLTNGASNKEIARKLSIAESTVKIHVKGVFRKIGAANRTQAAIWALMHAEAENPLPLPALLDGDIHVMNGAVKIQ